MRVDIVETPDLGHRSHVVSDGEVAVVVDPQRDVDRIEAVVASLGVSVAMVVETHLHNDYLSGGHALARRTGATHVVAGREDVAFARCAAHDGDRFSVGRMTVRVLATPGHTDTHLAYVLTEQSDAPPAVFSGGSLLDGTAGRTDLLGEDRTDDLTRKQWRSVRKLADLVPDDAVLYPTHGFEPPWSSGSARSGGAGTLGEQKVRNDALLEDEQRFVERAVARRAGHPAHYAHMTALNALGPDEPSLSPVRLAAPGELAARIRTGEWVVDLRDRTAYASRHLAGTVSIPFGAHFSTCLTSIVPWGASITLLADDQGQIVEAQRQLARIGIDRLACSATGEPECTAPEVPLRSYERTTFERLAQVRHAQLLDVRRDDEVAQHHIDRVLHIPLHDLAHRLHEVPLGKLWVHCDSGLRAGIAASLLDSTGRHVVHVDDDLANAEKAGLRLVCPCARPPGTRRTAGRRRPHEGRS